MIKFNYEKIMQPKTFVHIETEEQDRKFREWLMSIGKTWFNAMFYNVPIWEVYKEYTCMNPFDDCYSDLEFCLDKNYKIYKYEEVIMNTKEELQQELKETEAKLKSIRERMDSIEEENYLFVDGETITYRELIGKLELMPGDLECIIKKNHDYVIVNLLIKRNEPFILENGEEYKILKD